MRERKSSRHVKKSSRRVKKAAGGSALTAAMVILLALAAVITGLSLPGLASAIQSRNVDKLSRQAELGPGALKLTSDEKMLEKLRLVCLDYEGSEYETVELQNGRFLTPDEARASMAQVFTLTANTGLYTGGELNWHVAECSPFLLIPRHGDMATALLWLVEAEMKSGEDTFYMELLLDDETGLLLVLRFDGHAGQNTNHALTLNTLSENLQSYYGFQDTELLPPSDEEIDADTYYYSIHCFKDSQRVFDIPVFISPLGWQIGGSRGTGEAVEKP